MVSIAIDGPAGAGKTTVARAVAQHFGFIYVDTGAMYRTIGLYVLSKEKDTTDAAQVLPLLDEIKITIAFSREDGQRIFLNGQDVSEAIRQPEMSMAASNVSSIPGVRDFLFSLQRQSVKENNVVMDGRDIGTVVIPDADVKLFLTASAEKRAQRRYKEMIAKGMQVDYDQLLLEIKQRDYNDSHRAVAPLKQAQDAILVDTTDLTLEESIQRVISIVKDRLHHVL